jgi:hypothetical protein
MKDHIQPVPENIGDRDFVGRRIVYSTTEDLLERNRDNFRGKVPNKTPSKSAK